MSSTITTCMANTSIAGLLLLNKTKTEASHRYSITAHCALFDFLVYTVFCGGLCVVGLVGNAVSFHVLQRETSNGSPTCTSTTILLRSLAVADSLVLITAVPLYTLSPLCPYTKVMCRYQQQYNLIMPFLWPMYLISYTGTIMLTVLVSLNRYFAVCHPYRSTRVPGNSRTLKQIMFIAVFAVLYNIPRFFEYERIKYCDGGVLRHSFDLSNFGRNRVYRILYANVLYISIMHAGPLVSLAFLNVNLIRALKARDRKRAQMIARRASQDTPPHSHHAYQNDITTTLIGVIFVFMCCQTPTAVDHVLWTLVGDDQRWCGRWHYYYTALGDMLAILNSSVNFLVYVVASKRFRQNLTAPCVKYSPGSNPKIAHLV